MNARLPAQAYRLSFLLNPGNCVLCGRPALRALDLCGACEADLPWLHPDDWPCLYCGEPGAKTGVCHQCLTKPPANDSFLTAFHYEFPVDAMVQLFKTGQLAFGRVLSELLASQINMPATALVPIPLSRQRQRARGFNQAAFIAKVLSERHQLPVLDIARIKGASQQKALSAQQRQRNVKGIFRIKEGASVAGLNLTIVDDVYTTGATSRELALTLKRGGAARVNILTLARTPSPG